MTDRSPPTPVSRFWKVLLGIFTVIAWAPIAMAFAASGIASALGCRVNEAGTNPCLLAGFDIGEALYTMFMMMWLAFLTLPLLLITLVGWIIVWVNRAR
ncbi:hypothetical protein [Roseococcus sp. YIM B11640]|uniref:hypothetical protein n=1 Tax=Roseococcus sp. YIM B11640 TaxID=3133973 RepID=UPI003C7DD4E3